MSHSIAFPHPPYAICETTAEVIDIIYAHPLIYVVTRIRNICERVNFDAETHQDIVEKYTTQYKLRFTIEIPSQPTEYHAESDTSEMSDTSE